MSCYKVLLVDDEKDVRQAIANKLNWKDLGFELVAEAENGEEALELAAQLSPDVVFTDIRMPFMDGLTMCEQLKHILPNIKLAIFSGFDDFEYAKQAIALGVENYLLKPVRATELIEIFTKLYETLESEVRAKRDIEKLQRYYIESLPIIRQQILDEMIAGQADDETVRELGISPDSERFCIAAVQYRQFADVLQVEHSEGNLRLVLISLEQMIMEAISGAGLFCQMVNYRQYHTFVLFTALKREQTVAQLLHCLNQLFAPAKKILGLQLSIGVGRCYPNALDISLSYKEAVDALESMPFAADEQCIYIGDISSRIRSNVIRDCPHIPSIIRYIKTGERELLCSEIQNLIVFLMECEMDKHQTSIFILDMESALLKLCRTYSLDMAVTNIDRIIEEKQMSRLKDYDQLCHWLTNYCIKLQKLIQQEKKSSTKMVIDAAIEYINENYTNCALTVDTVCKHLNLSAAYFSTIFKKETTKSFVTYLTEVRMEKALKYITTTNEKSYVIAEKVGYFDPNYFSHVFKKFYGVSPSVYRAKKKVQIENEIPVAAL